MAELEIDQSNLPRVQEVEQYYTTNIQKNQLVQNDIRVAKRLQDEEEDQRAQQSADLRQASRQLEEQDLEYARVIQEELQRCAEEAHRREQDDEEIAKRMQDEEEQRIRARSRGQEGRGEDSAGDSALPATHQHTLSSQGGEQCSSSTTRWQYSTNHSDLTGTGAASHRGPVARESTTSGSNQGHTDSIRPIREELREALSEDSEESDTVFSAQLSDWSQRPNRRLNTAPPQHRAASRYPQERNYRSLNSRSSFRGWTEERGEGDYYDNECYDREKRRHGSRQQERSHREDYERWQRSGDQDRDSGSVEGRERRCSRSESVRLPDRSRHSSRDLSRTWSQRDNPDRRVHFQEDTRNSSRQPDESGQVWEMLGQVLRERGVAVTVGARGVPLQIGPQSRDSQVLQGSEVSCCSSRPHHRDFQRAATTRHSFHGDIRKRRVSSHRENSGRDHREEPDGCCDPGERGGEVNEISSRESNLASGEIRGSRRWSEHRNTDEEARGRNSNDSRVKRSTSERRPRHKTTERRLSSEEVREVEGRAEWPPRRAPQRSLSLSSTGASSMDRSRPEAEGVSLIPDPSETSLNLGELHQVLRDEELARKLQDEEDKLLRRISDPRSSQPPPRGPHPQGDFRVAQVAQDEEIARFMQKQEIKSKRRSRELEGPGSWREHRAMISHHDRRTARERQVQRERLDSEGLPSPTEDCCPENQPPSPSPSSTLLPAQQIRNIAEELDPTFQARRQDTERLPVEQTGPACQSLPVPHSGLNGFLVEPAFIPPTKRQPEKSTHSKPKEKKENCKQQ
ncbi:coiled-coil domain-containing protein 187 isoform X2 [Pleuronectes platessa]|uniref:coiled-coil domain-containing protein 187 isoform X2 n=1 Tax=Pleuronectes platessa TaxID=8262 RepID=UPI00232A0E39|nr:coiled-coil domain-containing protein 187 isoform X2 [Pleuronectes platessa]